MNDDFEDRIAAALNAQVDQELGERRTPPPFETPARRTARRRPPRAPWMLPLVAAASVVAVVAGSVGVTQLVADDGPASHPSPLVSGSISQSAAPSAGPSSASTAKPSSAAPSTPRSTPSRSTPDPSHVSRPPGRTVVLGDADVYLPVGWEARDIEAYSPPGSSSIYPGWCLTPKTTPVRPDKCPVRLVTISTVTNDVDVDIEGGLSANPHYCFPQEKSVSEQYGDRTLGGRAADWRRWEYVCKTGQRWTIEQYVVPTLKGYVLFSAEAGAAVHDALTAIAAHSSLPQQAAPVRLMDRGVVRSRRVVPDGTGDVEIELDRVIRTVDGDVNHNPATYEYRVPANVVQATKAMPKVGDVVTVFSNGRRVTAVYAYG